MDTDEILDRLRSQRGVVMAEVMPDDLFIRINREESGVTGAMGAVPVINTGLRDCIERDVRLALVVTDGFWLPEYRSMRMVDGSGRVVGHSVTRSEIPDYAGRDDVVFLSDDFVMYPDALADGTPSMELLSAPYPGEGGWIPEEMSPVIWYPCTTSSDLILSHYGVPFEGNATVIMALNLPGCR